MPRSKVGKKREPVNTDNLKAAIEDVILRQYSVCQAAENYDVSKTTLLRHLKQHRQSEDDEFKYKSKSKVRQIFFEEEENLLISYVKTAAKLHYGLPKKELQKLAYEFGNKNKKKMPDSWIRESKAGAEWIRGFLSRHPDVSLRKPEATSLSRATSFNKKNVSDFFKNLKNVYDRHNFQPNRIYNLDETGNTTVHVPPRILAPKGQKQIGAVTSAERGVNVTMVAAINAVGNHVPPMLIFPRVHFKEHMLKGAPPGAVGGANPSGWINESLFLQHLEHFIAHVKPTVEDKVLLIYDNHESHISLPVINLARENGLVLLTMPPHTSHKLQPLDRTVFGSYQTFYNQTMSQWMTNNPGKPVSLYDIAEIVGNAYPMAFSIGNIVRGFLVTGIWPFNENIFGEDEYLSSYITDRYQANGEDENKGKQNYIENGEHEEIMNMPTTSTDSQHTLVSPHVIRPFPKAAPRKEGVAKRRKGKTMILTDTPVKEEIEQYKSKGSKKKEENKVKQVKRNVFNDDDLQKPRKKNTKKKEDSSEDESAGSLRLGDDSSDESDKDNFYENIRKEAEDEEMDDDAPIELDDYILVELSSKKIKRHFVAKVINNCNTGYEVQFFKKIDGTTAARNCVPSDEEPSIVNVNNIVLRLPSPKPVGMSKRQENQLTFPVDFSHYHMF